MSEPLELCYCLAARRSARLLSLLYDRHLAPARVTVQQFAILSAIERKPGLLIADLADSMVMERTTLVRALKPLQGAGLVVGERSGNGRTLKYSVSSRGREKVAAAMPLWREAQREFELLVGTDKAAHLRNELQEACSVPEREA